jgi:sigma-B regulation protein RsbU (phosphoserine phosphatase)
MFEEAVFENMEIFLNCGDRLLLYTDGVIEARNPAGGSFEISHVQRILAERDDLSGDALVDAIYQELLQFTQRDRFEDDLCMVLVSIGE